MESSSLLIVILILISSLFLFLTKGSSKKRLPPGSMGFPIIGHTPTLLEAMRANKDEEWLNERIKKYGPISRMSLFGTPTIFLSGLAANKFMYTRDGNTLGSHQPTSIRRICGEKNIFELTGDDHKRVREALVSFLKPDALKQYVGKVDEEIQLHLNQFWNDQSNVVVMPLMKTLTFNVVCTLIFGIEPGVRRDILVRLFEKVMEGMLSLPINLPFTRFHSSLQASKKVKAILIELIKEKREALGKNSISSHNDLITALLSIRDGQNQSVISDEEIVDNAFVIMIGAHDTTSILLTFLVRLLARDPSIYTAIAHEQNEIAKSKKLGEHLTWEDLSNMKFTWRVAMEMLRMHPPMTYSFRRTLKEIEFGGFLIPKGWQVVWNASMTHKDEAIFPDPLKFMPRRFEQQATNNSTNIPPYSFVAFGAGARRCPGNELARIETLAMIHYLVTRFRWQLSCEDDSFYRDPMPVFNRGLPIQIHRKQPL
ncbi:OLC1v1021990C1 [Oldenlandia corymbosa var. corymbosa]|uniref:OLC1v1021990C1 n=1 Tax=Oldenlandia corymbosa var. corymbosa TaxID=529605 RepID=A0AAV1BX21_OLDCO|nr:OLC1v1021990C1 [Oldenlandia corymbosa var. corymbosa]